MTDKIASWPPNIEEWQTGSGQPLRLDGLQVAADTADKWLFLLVPGKVSFANIWDEVSYTCVEQVEGTSDEDAAVAGFNRLIELGIIKRRPVASVDSSVDCDGPVDDSPIFADNLE